MVVTSFSLVALQQATQSLSHIKIVSALVAAPSDPCVTSYVNVPYLFSSSSNTFTRQLYLFLSPVLLKQHTRATIARATSQVTEQLGFRKILNRSSINPISSISSSAPRCVRPTKTDNSISTYLLDLIILVRAGIKPSETAFSLVADRKKRWKRTYVASLVAERSPSSTTPIRALSVSEFLMMILLESTSESYAKVSAEVLRVSSVPCFKDFVSCGITRGF